MKPVIASKIVWVNVILTLLAVVDLVSTSPVIPPMYLPYVAMGAGILNIILRIYFTDAPVSGFLKVK